MSTDVCLVYFTLHKFNYINLIPVYNFTAPKYHWKRWDTNEVIMRDSAVLSFTNGLNRTDKGIYACIIENKHGNNVANFTINILCEYYHRYYFFYTTWLNNHISLYQIVPLIMSRFLPVFSFLCQFFFIRFSRILSYIRTNGLALKNKLIKIWLLEDIIGAFSVPVIFI